MNLTRRETVGLGVGALTASLLFPKIATATYDDTVQEFTGGASLGDSGITLTTPEIAENGNTVPISISAPGATAIIVLATRNPNPGIATFNFGPLAGEQVVSTRIRLAETQEVVAIARMPDGSFVRTSNTVKVTIGGCGG